VSYEKKIRKKKEGPKGGNTSKRKLFRLLSNDQKKNRRGPRGKKKEKTGERQSREEKRGKKEPLQEEKNIDRNIR